MEVTNEVAVQRVERPVRARLGRWPYEPDVAHLVLLDHQMVPSPTDVAGWIAHARAAGCGTIRTGALFPLSTDPFVRAGFSAIDRLALLETPLGAQHRIGTTTRTRPLRSRHMDDAAAIDRRAFGPPWGNDRAALADILRATPSCRIRSVAVGRAMSGFAITGVAGRTGYLQRLAVDPGAQRRGLGRALVADSLVWMRRRGARHAMVNTAFDNVAAISLYESFGFRQRDDSLVILELRLDPRAG